MRQSIALMGCLMASLFAAISVARAQDGNEAARAVFAPVVKEHAIPGLIVGITRNGKHSFYLSGLASKADRRAVTPDTLFELGSISKIFTVTLAALAEERGKLRLDDTLAQHLCAGAWTTSGDLTLMDLATHRSGGLPLQVPNGIKTVDGLARWLKSWQPPKPGARSYSNISIGLLGHVTGKALDMPYKQAVQTVLFPAFGLENSWIDVPKRQMALYAYGYDWRSGAPIRVNPGLLDAEAYGVKSSARDMLQLLDVELGHADAPKELRKAIARTREPQYRTAFFTQDMIWEQYPWPVGLERMVAGNGPDMIMTPQPVEALDPAARAGDPVILNKTGSTNGFGNYIAMVPSERLGVVMLANKNIPIEARVRATYALIKALLGP
ncbi:class C beta-lactamase [Rhizobium rhizosphaerae]|uniref:Beta-lactamase n=2 Tax=Xaviernesmea rhizosphaerae TaxID=1672749 RepID=A0ABX3PE44_9HYPH|nr:class C beta-lactamase [Xaviernesmea rhizosphaerae]